ncbi:MAG: penicillin-binding protein 1C [Chloroflexi bacterium]|nr:penicillin-binding protein 1C [Chloroflexota bacterium]
MAFQDKRNPNSIYIPKPGYQPSRGTIVKQAVLYGILGIIGLFLLGIIAAMGVYGYYALTLPSPQELYQRATPFQSTRIYDRNGRLLYEVFDPQGGKRTIVRYDDISPWVVRAVVSTEDRTFFTNPGFSPRGIVRAIYQNVMAGYTVSGASTITQQLVKNVYLTTEQTLTRKVKEAILAVEITRRYEKDEILEVYLNEVYFGNMAYGISAAAESYFGKQPTDLTLSESALLAGMLQSPAMYDPYLDPQAALDRRTIVLNLMVEAGYISQEEADAAAQEPLGIIEQNNQILAPHLVMYVREQLEAQYGTEALYKGGLQVYTTLDFALQQQAEQIVAQRVAELADYAVSNGALVAIDPHSGDVLAMVGSADFFNADISGQVNITRQLRQPGSTIKPFTYLAALERGWTASTMLMDVAQDFPDGANPPYRPVNVDGKEYGPISLRSALANSRNIPAVSTLNQIGLPALLEMTQRLGITTLNRDDYGLSLTLGGGEVTLIQMTAAYATLANSGKLVSARTILRIENADGQVLVADTVAEQPQVVDNRLTYIITDILADNDARSPAFGTDSVLNLGFPAAVKTGTTNDNRDGWTIGYTPELVTGVWVGNADNSQMAGVGGSFGAGPIWHNFMEAALADKVHESFMRPDGIVEVEVCPISGMLRGPDCPAGRKELFLADQQPTATCSVHIRQKICTASGKLANSYCPLDAIQERQVEDYGAQWDAWLAANGKPVPVREICDAHGAPSKVEIYAPANPLKGIVDIRGSTLVDKFKYYIVEYGIGPSPIGWGTLTHQIGNTVADGLLMRWDTRTLEDGIYSLRVVVSDTEGRQYEAKIQVEVRNTEPTATMTMASTATPTYTRTPKGTLTPTFTPTLELPTATVTPEPLLTATEIATPSATATIEPEPSNTPSPAATEIPSATLTPSKQGETPTPEEPSVR